MVSDVQIAPPTRPAKIDVKKSVTPMTSGNIENRTPRSVVEGHVTEEEVFQYTPGRWNMVRGRRDKRDSGRRRMEVPTSEGRIRPPELPVGPVREVAHVSEGLIRISVEDCRKPPL